jgi:hypothetical protein
MLSRQDGKYGGIKLMLNPKLTPRGKKAFTRLNVRSG